MSYKRPLSKVVAILSIASMLVSSLPIPALAQSPSPLTDSAPLIPLSDPPQSDSGAPIDNSFANDPSTSPDTQAISVAGPSNAPELTPQGSSVPDNQTAEQGKTSPQPSPETLLTEELPPVQNVATDPQRPQKAEVSEDSGALVYSFPIVVPPGRNNLQPTLKLTYSSDKPERDSIVGAGWSISIPSIERVNRRGVDLLYSATNSPVFVSSMDGELATTTVTSIYAVRTDNGTFNSYTFSDDQWVITDKSGTQYTFGSTASSRQDDPSNSARIYKWMLAEVRDTNDNYIKYTYSKDSGQIYPASIVYTGHDTTDGIFEIDFSKEARDDSATSWKTGFGVATYSRIDEIDAKVNGVVVRKYVLAYTASETGKTSLLSSITESGYDQSGASVTLPSVTFTYESNDPGWNADDADWHLPVDLRDGYGYDLGYQLIDVNGDGLPDIERNAYGSSPEAYINNGHNWISDSTWNLPVQWTAGDHDNGYVFVDVNGDHLPDIMRSDDAPSYASYINNGHGWTSDSSWNLPVAWLSGAGYDNGYRFLDVNGDGLPDIVKSVSNTGWSTNEVYINNGNNWSLDTSWQLPVYLFQSGYWQGYMFADVNGDGLPDIVRSSSNAGSNINEVYLNRGHGWTLDDVWQLPVYFYQGGYEQGYRLVDVNDDGLPDVVRATNSTQETYLNSGRGWNSDDSDWHVPGQLTTNDLKNYGLLTDSNGDGLPDYQFSQSPSAREAKISRGMAPELLTGIAHSAGGTTHITYKQVAGYFDASNNLISTSVPFSLNTAYQISTDDGTATSTIDTYTYKGGKFQYYGPFDKKFAGFAEVDRTDSAGNITKTYYHTGSGTDSAHGEYEDDYWKIGKPYRVEKYDESGHLYEKTINKWETVTSTTSTLSGFVSLTRSVQSAYDGLASHKDRAESYTYDPTNGNRTQTIEWGEVTGSDDGSFSDTGSDKRTTDLTYAASTSSDVIGAVSRTTLTDQDDNKVKEIKYYFDNLPLGSIDKGNQTKQEDLKTGSTYISSERAYNEYGLSTSSTDPRGKVTTSSYDEYDLYPITVTQPLGLETHYLYDYSSGKVATSTDPNGNIFANVYDGLDRLLLVKQPDPSATTTPLIKTAYAYTDTSGAVNVHQTDYLNSATTVETYTYYDGLKRQIQIRRSDEVGYYGTRDFSYNDIGLLEKESLPYFSSGAARTSSNGTAALYTTYSYDALERPTAIANVLGTTTKAYANWAITTTDLNGKAKDLRYDAYGNLIAVDEYYTKTGTGGGMAALVGPQYAFQPISTTGIAIDRANYSGSLASLEDHNAATDSFAPTSAPETTPVPVPALTSSLETPVSSPLRSVINGVQPTELVSERTYTSRKFANPNGSYTLEAHVGHIFYKQNGQYLPIDETLHRDDARGGWTFTTHSFKPFIPDTCEGWIEFRDTFESKDQTVKYRPKGCRGIEGRLVSSVPGLTDQNAVIYDNAFGSGYDLIVYFTRSSMRKVVRLRQGYPTNHDLTFDFEVQFPNASIYRAKSPSDITANTPKVSLPFSFVGDDQTLIGDDQHDGQEWYTYLRPFQAWDSSTFTKSIAISVSYFSQSGKQYLEKTIPQSFLAKAKGDVFADTTSSYYAGSGDGYVGRGNTRSFGQGETWSQLRDGDGQDVDYTQSSFYGMGGCQMDTGTNKYLSLTRGIFPFDTSAMGAGAIISSGSVNLYSTYKSNEPSLAVSGGVYGATPASNTALQASDYGQIGTSAYASTISYASWNNSGYNTFTLNSTGLAAVDPTGYTVIGFREGSYDAPNATPNWSWASWNFGIYPSEYTGTDRDPYMSITYASAPLPPTDLLTDGETNPTIVATSYPYFSAVYRDPNSGDEAAHFRLQVSTSSTNWDSTTWDSDKTEMATTTEGTRSPNIYYGGDALDLDGTTYYWRIKFWDDEDHEGDFSTSTASFTMDAPPLSPTDLLTEGEADPSDVIDTTPEFSAMYQDSDSDDEAAHFRLQVSTSSTNWDSTAWDSGKTEMATTTEGTRSPDISFGGTPLVLDGTTYYWRIKFWDVSDAEGSFSTSTASFTMAQPPTAPTDLLTEGIAEPGGVTDASPEFSAVYNDPEGNDTALYYRLQVSTASDDWDAPIWDSGKTAMTETAEGSRSPDISYGGSALAFDGTTYYWRVKFWDSSDAEGAYSAPVSFAMADTYETTYTYNALNLLTRITDANGNVRNFTYDDLGRRLTAEDLHGSGDETYGTWTYTHDDSGNLTQVVDPKDQTINRTYDDLNRILTEDYTGQEGTEMRYEYDSCTEGAGRLCSASSSAFSVANTYNALGQLVQESKTITGTSTTFVASYAYDRQGNQLTITNPDNSEVRYTYNSGGKVETVQWKESADSAYNDVVTNFDYAPTGKVAYQVNANCTETVNSYDPAQLYRLMSRRTVYDSEGSCNESKMMGYAGHSGPFTNPLMASVEENTAEIDSVDSMPGPDPISPIPASAEPSSSPEPASVTESPEPTFSETPSPTPELTSPTPSVAEPASSPESSSTTETPEPPSPSPESSPTSASDSSPISAPAPTTRFDWNSRTEMVNGTERTELHIKQINFKNAEGNWQPIDVKPVWSGSEWVVAATPFIARFPQRSSGTATMVNNNRWDTVNDVPIHEQDLTMTIRAEDVADVEGVLEHGDLGYGDEWYIRYPQAYPAQNADLIFLVWHGKVPRLQKLIRFNSALAADTDFSFDYSYPTKDPEFKKNGTKWDKKLKFDANKGLRVGNDRDRHGFGFKDFKIWDSGIAAQQRSAAITVDLENLHSGEYRLTKHIPSSFFSGATLPVYTDTTSTFYPDPDPETNSIDGRVYTYAEGDNSWSTLRSMTTNTYADDSSNAVNLNIYGGPTSNTWWVLTRGIYVFDTSSIGAGSTISTATFSVYGWTTNEGPTVTYGVVTCSPASNTSLTASDYNLANWTMTAQSNTTISQYSWNTSGYNDFALNSTGLGTINMTGATKFCTVNTADRDNSAPGWANQYSGQSSYSSEWSGTDKDPKLVVDWTLSTPLAPTDLLTDGETNPTVVATSYPYFSAVYRDPNSGDEAAHFRLQVSTSSTNWDSTTWDSAKTEMATTTEGTRSPNIYYGGDALDLDGATYYWRIKFWDDEDHEGIFSTSTASFTMDNASPPTDLLTDGQTNPTGVATAYPYFSAIYHDYTEGDIAEYYRLQVSTSSTNWDSTTWDSAKTEMATTTEGTRSPNIYYGGSALAFDGETYYWRIKFWDDEGHEGVYSATTASFAMASPPTPPSDLLTEGDTNPTGVADITPEFSAIFNDPYSDDTAHHFRLQVSASSTDWNTLMWDSGKVDMASTARGNRSPDISYGYNYSGGFALPLDANTTYYWRIKFWDADDSEGEFSTVEASFTANPTYIQEISYIYDAVGNVTGITNSSPTDASSTITFVYDDLYRLTSANATGTPAGIEGYTQTFTYDALGNILSKSDVGEYTYATSTVPGYANPDAVTDISGMAIGYDENGNVTSVGATAFSWDYLNRLMQVGAGTVTSTYAYDPSGQRVRATDDTGTSATTTYYVSGSYGITGNTPTKHIFANGELIATVVGVAESVAVSYVHTDHLGGANVVTDSDGSIAEVLDYYPYGSNRLDEQTGVNEARKFIGQYYDSSTQLSYLNARYYAGDKGRFLSQDPVFWEVGQTQDGKAVLQNPQALNSYAYTNGNPITYKDPEGRVLPLVILAAGPYLLPATVAAIGAITTYFSTKEAIKVQQDPNASFADKATAWGVAAGSAFTFGLSTAEFGASLSSGSSLTGVQANKAAGDAFEAQQFKQFSKEYPGLQSQVTIETQSGVKTRIDFMGRTSTGQYCLFECKSSATAPLTPNQSFAFPEIQSSGARVVGHGKPGFPGGTQIPPTMIRILRP